MSQSDYIEHIARISKGKDSLKMLDVIHTRGLPLDRVTTTDVWATDTIRAELPEVLEAKERIEEKLWQMYRINVEHLCAMNPDGTKRTYEQMFYHIPNRRSQSGQVERQAPARLDPRIPGSMEQMVPVRPQTECPATEFRDRLRDFHPTPGTTGARSSRLSETSIKGWPLSNGRLPWCQNLKVRAKPLFSQCPATRGRKRKIVEYIGIAADEPDRFGQLSEWKRAPLVEFGIEENLCGLFCQYNDMLLPSYDTGCRDGCWFCHNQGVDQLRNLWRNYPDHWALLMKWDLDSPVTFKADGHTVHDFDRRFRMEEDGVIPMDNTFRWYPVDNYITMFDLLKRGED